MALGLGPVQVWVLVVLGVAVFGGTFYAMRELFKRRSGASASDERAPDADSGLHHITLLVADVERSLAFYRNVLGLRLVKQTVNDDDQPRATSSSATRRGGPAR